MERRASPRKRVSETVAETLDRGRGRAVRRGRSTVTIEDLSEDGARLVGPTQAGVAVGTSIEIKMAAAIGTVTVRYIAPDPLEPDHSIYGVEVAKDNADLRQAIRARMESEETTMEWVWAHT